MIGVLGGTGVTGSRVVAALKAKGADFKCITRDTAAARARLGDDVALAAGDLADPASLDAALSGLDALYILCGHSPRLAEMETNALEAAKRAGIAYVVEASGTEQGIRPDSPSEIMRQHHAVEQAVRASGLQWAISRPNFFMSNLLGMAQPIAQDSKMITALPAETTVTMIHPDDIGESAAELLTNRAHAGETCFLTGAPVTMGGVAETLSDVLGRKIAYVQVPPEALKKVMEERGMPDWLVAHQGAMMGIVAKGGMAGETDWVQRLTGHAPRSLATWIEENRAAFGG
jgi:uncharacterized protein YbjT (DUF2867 family)